MTGNPSGRASHRARLSAAAAAATKVTQYINDWWTRTMKATSYVLLRQFPHYTMRKRWSLCTFPRFIIIPVLLSNSLSLFSTDMSVTQSRVSILYGAGASIQRDQMKMGVSGNFRIGWMKKVFLWQWPSGTDSIQKYKLGAIRQTWPKGRRKRLPILPSRTWSLWNQAST
jgi:hypothetical protein